MRESNSTIQVGAERVKWRSGRRGIGAPIFCCSRWVAVGGISRKLPFIAMSGQAHARSFPPSPLSPPPLHVTRTHAVVWYPTCLLGSCGVGLFAEKVISALSLSLSPLSVMHSVSSQPSWSDAANLRPSPMWVRYTTFATFLAFFWCLPPLPLSPPSGPPSVSPSATHKILKNFSTLRIWRSGARLDSGNKVIE